MMSVRIDFVGSCIKRPTPLLLLKRFKTISKFKVYDPREKALSHFDDFYKALFGHRWPSIRLGLLSKEKYVAVLNNFTDTNRTEQFLQAQGAFDLGCFLNNQKSNYRKSDAEASVEGSQNKELGEVIGEQLEQVERRQLGELHLEGTEHLSKVDVMSEENKEREEKREEVLYNPEEARSSLHADLLSSQMDMSRVIQPEEGLTQTSLNEFVPVTLLRGLEDYIPESEYYKYYQVPTDTPIAIEKENEFEYPENLKVYTFDRGDVSEFPSPGKDIHDIYRYQTVEGSELLAALALGVRPGDKVLDLCSFSGGMAYCILQTLWPKVVVCVTSGRPGTANTFRGHLCERSPSGREMLMITDLQLHEYENDELFDKVLINVPSTEDKLSLLRSENNIFHVKKVRRRLKLPEFQRSLLLRALNMVRPGGTVVYSTSTLSPIQNDGVISSALQSAWETSKMEVTVKDLRPALEHASFFFNFGDFLNMKYGTLVVPFVPSNFGPKYFCKLVKKGAKE